MNAPLVSPQPRTAALELTAGAVACTLQLALLDRRRKVALYDMYLANLGANRATCRFFGTSGPAVHEFGLLEVAAKSVAHARFSVPYDRAHRCRRLCVQVAGDDIALLSEAQPPWPLGWNGAVRTGLTLGACGAAALGLAALTALIGAPRILALDAGHSTGPGTVQVRYGVRGAGDAAFAATTEGGTLLAAGPLDRRRSEFDLTIPRAAAGQHIRVALTLNGPIGKDEREIRIAVPLPAAAAPDRVARIVSLTARRDRYSGRTSVLVSYGAVADRGRIRVLDPTGAVVGGAPFLRGGTSRVLLARDLDALPLRTELIVHRGRSQAYASVEIPPESVPQTPAAAALPVSTGDVAQADPFVVPARVAAGAPLRIGIRARLPNMRIALQDEIGGTIDEQPVPPTARSLSFTAPASGGAQIYYIVCTYTHRAAEETIVRSVRVIPH
ncbi:MAG: hypothetical protein NVSMB64_07310 [Candidatus Velthaea sp.]